MFVEPLTVLVNAVSKTLPRVVAGDRKATYESTADGLTLSITHVVGKRNRHTIRLDSKKTAADPLLDGVSRAYSMSTYLVVDAPEIGFTLTEQKQIVKALTDWLGTSTNTDKVLAGES